MSQSEARRTAMIKKLFAVLAELSLQEGFQTVTVEEISQAAGIHRSTFYRHLESKDDLLERGTHIFWDEIMTKFEEYRHHRSTYKPALLNTDEVPDYMIYFFELVRERRDIFLSFLNNNGSPYFCRESRKRIGEYINDHRLSKIVNLSRNDDTSEFITSCLITTLEIVSSKNSMDAVENYYRFVTRGTSGFIEN